MIKLKERCNDTAKRLQEIESSCSNDLNQHKEDLKQLLLEFKALSNTDMAIKIKDFFTDKYRTKMWTAIVYNGITGFHKHTINFFVFQFRIEGKNAAVVGRSRHKKKPLITRSEIIQQFKFPYYNEFCEISVPCQEPADVGFDAFTKQFPGRASIGFITKWQTDLRLAIETGMDAFIIGFRYVDLVVVPHTKA